MIAGQAISGRGGCRFAGCTRTGYYKHDVCQEHRKITCGRCLRRFTPQNPGIKDCQGCRNTKKLRAKSVSENL